MSFQTIGVGSTANDGTGDPLRTAFQKVNTNFALIASGNFTLSAGGGTYTISNASITTNSKLFLEGLTEDARTLYPFLTITKSPGSISITYPNNSNADCTFDYFLLLF
jgi:hypothetical protein